MCPLPGIGMLLGGLLGGIAPALLSKKPDTSEAERLQMEALEEQKRATAEARARADTESETAKTAEEQRLRRVTGAGAFGSSFTGSFAPASVGYRTAFGE